MASGCRPRLPSRRTTAECPAVLVSLRAPRRCERPAEPCRVHNRCGIRRYTGRCSCPTDRTAGSGRAGRCSNRRSTSPHSRRTLPHTRRQTNNRPRTDQRRRPTDHSSRALDRMACRMQPLAQGRTPVGSPDQSVDHMWAHIPDRTSGRMWARASGRHIADRTLSECQADTATARSRCRWPTGRTPGQEGGFVSSFCFPYLQTREASPEGGMPECCRRQQPTGIWP
jgi:hypothetical protein